MNSRYNQDGDLSIQSQDSQADSEVFMLPTLIVTADAFDGDELEGDVVLGQGDNVLVMPLPTLTAEPVMELSGQSTSGAVSAAKEALSAVMSTDNEYNHDASEIAGNFIKNDVGFIAVIVFIIFTGWVIDKITKRRYRNKI